LKQVPIAPNFVSTTHKLQSASLDELTLAEFSTKDPNMRKVLHGSHIYVLLSRVRTLKGLYLLKPITMEDIQFFYSIIPPYRAEFTRLEQLAQMSRSHFPFPSTVLPDLTVPGANTSSGNSIISVNTKLQASSRIVKSTPAVGLPRPLATRTGCKPFNRLLECTADNHALFDHSYNYNMATAPPTGSGVYMGPLDVTYTNATSRATTFSWLYMPILLNALQPLHVYFKQFVEAMPIQYRLLICHYRQCFQVNRVTCTSHAAATADGPLHFSAQHQEELMHLPPISASESVSPRLYCETLVGLLYTAIHSNVPQPDAPAIHRYVCRELEFLFPDAPYGFPFQMCAPDSCSFCGHVSASGTIPPFGPPAPSAHALTSTGTAARALLDHHILSTELPIPHRRIHTWESNSCYVDVALQTWYHILQVAGKHCNYEVNINNFQDIERIPEALHLGFFPPQLKRCLAEWVRCKLALQTATIANQV
jgi:hypothetical protein